MFNLTQISQALHDITTRKSGNVQLRMCSVFKNNNLSVYNMNFSVPGISLLWNKCSTVSVRKKSYGLFFPFVYKESESMSTLWKPYLTKLIIDLFMCFLNISKAKQIKINLINNYN